MKKRILAFALTLCMCLSLLPMTVFADEGITIDETNLPDADFRAYDAGNYDSDEYIEMVEDRVDFCESDGSKIIDDSIERITGQAVIELVPRKGNSSYGYYDLANEINGENMQRLYYSMYLDAEAFYNNTSDLNDSLQIGSYNIGEYDLTVDEAVAVWKIFYQENPLYYWLSNTVVANGDQMSVCIDGSYKLYANRLACNESIKAMLNEFNETLSDSMNDLEIALAAHDFIVKRIDYAYEADGVTPQDELWVHNIIGTAMKQYGVCESYAKTYMCLCLINDVDCIVVGGIGNNEDHMWNLVKIDEAWYGVDVTWDDTGTEELSYTCFGMSDSALNLSHTADSVTASGIDYQYALPQVSEDNIQLVYLYKGEQYLGTYINIDAAFEAMTDKNAEYTIKLQTYTVQGPLLMSSVSVMHEIKSSVTPEVKKITIYGKHIDLANGFIYTYPVIVDDSLMLGSDLDIIDLSIIVTGTLDLKGFTLSTYGFHCALDGNIIGDTTAESRSYINAYTSYETEIGVNRNFVTTVNVFGVQCMTYGPRIRMRGSANIQLASGHIEIFSYPSSNYFIKNYVAHADEPMGIICIEGGTSVEIENIICGRAGYYNFVIIYNDFGKLEDFNHLKISGGTECRIEYHLWGEVIYVSTDMDGNEVGRWVEQANPDDLTVPILNIGDPSILDYLTVLISDNLIDFDALYELRENGDIVRKKFECIRCHIDLTPVAAKDSTCKEQGWDAYYKCGDCGQLFASDGVTEIDEVPFRPLGNHSGAWTQTKEPTCTEKGEERRDCDNCNYYETREKAALGHDFGEWMQTKEPTCTEKGEETRCCSRCEETEIRELDALSHDTELIGKKDATCTEDGYTGDEVCKRCHETITKGEVIPFPGHDYDSSGYCKRCHNVKIDSNSFPDSTFRSIVLENYDKDGNQYLSNDEIADVWIMDLGNFGLSSIKGIEYFPNLVYLNCSNNALTKLDVSKNPALESLYCHYNDLTSLDVSKNTALAGLYCFNNALTELDVSKNTALESLYCDNNALTELDVSKNTALTELGCNFNAIAELDVSKNTALTELYCGNNQLTALDVSKNTALKRLSCAENDLTSLDVSKNTALTWLSCESNALTELDVSRNPALEALWCSGNAIAKLDLNNNQELQDCVVSTQSIALSVPLNGYDLGKLIGSANLSRITKVKGGSLNNGIICCEGGMFTYYYDTKSNAGNMQVVLTGHVHDYGAWSQTKAPTCTEKGQESRYCSCGQSETREVAALGHDYAATVTAPTCTAQGYTTHSCTRCTSSYVDTYVSALGHNDDGGVVTKAATCTEAGTITHSCTRCKAVLSTDTIPATGHNYGAWSQTKAPTCTEKGQESRYCSCGQSETREVAALGHNYTSTVTAPTCTAQGYTTHSCTRCTSSYVDSYVPALGHDFHDGECSRCHIADPKVDPQSKFTDAVPETHWAHDAIDYVLERHIMSGMSETTFEPNGTLTRAMVVNMLYNLAGEPTHSGENKFTDVPAGAWYADAVLWASENKIVSGKGDGIFDPNGNITREQLAIMMQNYAKYIGKDTSASEELDKFEDAGTVSSWATDAVKWACANKIVSGSSDGSKLYLNPKGNATRAQIAVIFENFCTSFAI